MPAPGCVQVRATKKGYHFGPREPGDVFDVPVGKDGKNPKASWFDVIEKPKKAPPGGDEELA